MHIDQVLVLLLSSLSLQNNKVMLSWLAVNLWQKDTLNLLLDNKLLVPALKANNIQCQGCEKHCCVNVTAHKYPNRTLHYALCEDAYMHEEMGRMHIPPEQLKQWKISIKQVAQVVADLLGFSTDISYQANQQTIKLGYLESKAGRKSVILNVEPLTLIINQSELPINEILFFDGNKLRLDNAKIDNAVKLKQPPHTKIYRPNSDKKAVAQANKEAMYLDWHDQAIKFKKKHPHQSKTWISQQIAKMAIGKGKSAETIRKNMNI